MAPETIGDYERLLIGWRFNGIIDCEDKGAQLRAVLTHGTPSLTIRHFGEALEAGGFEVRWPVSAAPVTSAAATASRFEGQTQCDDESSIQTAYVLPLEVEP